MNFQPLPDLRQVAIAELSLQIDQYFASGNTASEIPPGVSGETTSRNLPRQQEKLRAQGAKDAPALKELLDQGYSLRRCAKALGSDWKRIKLIAQESGLTVGAKR